jgi:hypothetical protein
MDPFIEFEWKGVKYEVPREASVLNKIVLPDGQVLTADSWLDSEPPRPMRLHLLTHGYMGSGTPEHIAKFIEGVVATVKPVQDNPADGIGQS